VKHNYLQIHHSMIAPRGLVHMLTWRVSASAREREVAHRRHAVEEGTIVAREAFRATNMLALSVSANIIAQLSIDVNDMFGQKLRGQEKVKKTRYS
jgi:hypothetical protein